MINETTNFTLHDFRIQTKSTDRYTMSTHHFHEVYELYYLNEGSRDYFINDKTYRVTAGDLVLIKPHDIHKTIDTGVGHSRLLISFRPSFIPFHDCDRLLDACFRDSGVLSLDLKEQSRLENQLRDMVLISSEKNDYCISTLQLRLFQFLLTVAGYLQNQNRQPLSDMNQKVYDIIHYLKNNHTKDVQLKDLAEEFYISRYYMTRLFKKTTGFTIIEYLHSLRIVEAQKLLKETKLKIIDVAQQVGFGNVSSFGKVFKSVTGLTPSEYRKQQKN